MRSSIDTLIPLLQTRGVRVEVADWLRLCTVLERGEEWPFARFSNVLVSLLATSREQGDKVREALEVWRRDAEQEQKESDEARERAARAEKDKQGRTRRLLLLLGALSAVLAFAIPGAVPGRHDEPGSGPVAATGGAPGDRTTNGGSPNGQGGIANPNEGQGGARAGSAGTGGGSSGSAGSDTAGSGGAPQMPVEPPINTTRPSERVVSTPRLEALGTPVALASSLVLIIALPVMLAVAYVRRRRKVLLEEEGTAVRLKPNGTSSFWLSSPGDATGRILSVTESDTLLSGISSFETSEETRELDEQKTIDETIERAGSPAFRFKARTANRRIWLLHDLASEGGLAGRLLNEIRRELDRHGVDSEIAGFWGLPYELEQAGERRWPIEVLTNSASDDVMAIVTDGRTLLERWHRPATEQGENRHTVQTLLQRLSACDRLAFFHVGPSNVQHELAALLARYGLRCFGPSLLARFVAAQGTLEADSTEPPLGPAWLWAACCAVYPLPIPEAEALRLREKLELPVSAHALPLLQARSVSPQAIQFSPEQRQGFVRRLQQAFQSESHPKFPRLLRNAVAYWRERTIGGEKAWQSETTGRGLHRRLIVALLDLWVDVARAAKELAALRSSPHFARLSEELQLYKPADAAGPGIDLPFDPHALEPAVVRKLDRFGLSGLAPDAGPRNLALLAVAGLMTLSVGAGLIAYSVTPNSVRFEEHAMAHTPYAISARPDQRQDANRQYKRGVLQTWQEGAEDNLKVRSKGSEAVPGAWQSDFAPAAHHPVVNALVAGQWVSLGAFPPGSVLHEGDSSWLGDLGRWLAQGIAGTAQPPAELSLPCQEDLPGGGKLRRCGKKPVPEDRHLEQFGGLIHLRERIAILDARPDDSDALDFADELIDGELVDALWIGTWPGWIGDNLGRLPGASGLKVDVYSEDPAFIERGAGILALPVDDHCWVRSNQWRELQARVALAGQAGTGLVVGLWPRSSCHGELIPRQEKPHPLDKRSLELWDEAQKLADALRNSSKLRFVSGRLQGSGLEIRQRSNAVAGGVASLKSIRLTYTNTPSFDLFVRDELQREGTSEVSKSQLFIDRDGAISQIEPLAAQGASEVRIALANVGRVEAQGKTFASVGGSYPVAGADTLELSSEQAGHKLWQAYTAPQLATLIVLGEAILRDETLKRGGIREILATKDGEDPGPAFPMAQFRTVMEPLLSRVVTIGKNPDRMDADSDGLGDDLDRCPSESEDFDGFQDEDGCPDPDNDVDGILDVDDRCPNLAEDRDGDQDDDGCPEGSSSDRDGDGIPDNADKCPDTPEDRDGFEDGDGCPELDNDKDGIPDKDDKCPDEPEDKDGFEDTDGCPDPSNDKDGIPEGGAGISLGDMETRLALTPALQSAATCAKPGKTTLTQDAAIIIDPPNRVVSVQLLDGPFSSSSIAKCMIERIRAAKLKLSLSARTRVTGTITVLGGK